MRFKVGSALSLPLNTPLIHFSQGVAHNIPLLRNVISHPRCQSGDISTKFLAQEYPTAFLSPELTPAMHRELASVAAGVHTLRAMRDRSQGIAGVAESLECTYYVTTRPDGPAVAT